MNYTRRLTFIFAIIVTLTVNGRVPSMYKNVDVVAMNAWVDSNMNILTPREKIAQLVVAVVSPDGTETALNSVAQYVKRNKVGGLLFSKGKITDHAMLTNYAQSISDIPLLMTLDGEWGLSMRMPDAPNFPKNMVLGAISNDKLLYEYGAEVARECRRLGVHVNFAPVLDVNTNPKNPVIGNRSFGDSPEMVARKGIAYAKGLEDGGVMAVAKHFPGHGATAEDSHKTLPIVDCGEMELNLVHIYPFSQYIKAGLSGVLVGHLNVPSLDNSEIPSSLSNNIVTKLLQEKLDFQGLTFTDALAMKGVGNSSSNCVNALLAGNDVLLSPNNVSDEIKAIENAIKLGVLTQTIIDTKCRKMLQYKFILGLDKPQAISLENIVADVNSSQSRVLIRKLWGASITVISDNNKLLPIKSLSNNRIAVISLSKGADTEFQKCCALYSATTPIAYGSIDNEKLGQFDTAIVAVYDDTLNSIEILKRISENCKNVIPVFFINPYNLTAYKDILNKENVSPVIAYDDCELAQNYAAQAIYGGIDVSGKLPVDIEGMSKSGVGVQYRATRLGYTIPDEVGVDGKLLLFIDSIANAGVKNAAFPGCQILVAKNGKVICNNSYGYLDNVKSSKVEVESIYDLASVSKATGTLAGMMKAYDYDLISLDDKASQYIKELRATDKSQITIRDLLFHESGMLASLNMYNIMLDSATYSKPLFKNKRDKIYSIPIGGGGYGNCYAKLRTDILSSKPSSEFDVKISNNIYGNRATYDTIMNRIYCAKLRKNKNYNYSCLNFSLLMNVEERVTHETHDKFVEREIFAPLGANHTLYRPLSRFNASQIAVTEQDDFLRHQKMCGYVHDELACFSGGVQGNAGLFSNANDIAKLCQMWLNYGRYGGEQILSPKTVKLFTTTKSNSSRRGLGFDKPDKKDDKNSPTCEEASAATYGHLGFTGTCFWVDPEKDLIYIFLCNRVCPTRDNKAFNDLNIRPLIFSAIYKFIDSK